MGAGGGVVTGTADADRFGRFARGVSEAATALSMIREHPSVVDAAAGEAMEAIIGRLFDLCDRYGPAGPEDERRAEARASAA